MEPRLKSDYCLIVCTAFLITVLITKYIGALSQ